MPNPTKSMTPRAIKRRARMSQPTGHEKRGGTVHAKLDTPKARANKRRFGDRATRRGWCYRCALDHLWEDPCGPQDLEPVTVTLTCEMCKQPFQKAEGGGKPRFCSDRCRKRQRLRTAQARYNRDKA